MKNIFLLTKIFTKTAFYDVFKLMRKKKTNRPRLSLIILFLLLFLYLAFMVGFQIYFIGSEFVNSNLDPFTLFLALVPGTAIFILLIAPLTLISLLFLTTDNTLFLPLPVKPKEIFFARLLSAYIVTMLITLIAIAPMFLGLLPLISVNITLILYLLIYIFLLPILPITIITFIALLLARFLKIGKLKIIFSILGFTAIIAISFALPALQFSIENINNVMTFNGIVKNINYCFPLTFLMYSAFLHYTSFSGLLFFLLFLLTVVGAIIILLLLASRLYLPIMLDDQNKTTKKSGDFILKETKSIDVTVFSLIKQDFISLKRSPILLVNILLVPFIVPAIIFFTSIISLLFYDVNILNQNFKLDGSMLATIVAITAFFRIGNSAAVTSYSREGESVYFYLYTPLSRLRIFYAKFLLAFILPTISFLLFFIPIMILLNPLTNFFFFFYLFIIFLLSNALSTMIGILIDLRFPKIHWTSLTNLVKQNMNILLTTLVEVVFSIVFFIVAIIISSNGLDYLHQIGIITILVLLLSNYLLFRHSIWQNKNFYRRIM